MRTYSPKPGDAGKKRYVIDATDVILGRLTAQTAVLLCGKHKSTFAPHTDMGDYVIIINADRVALADKKLDQRMTYRHSGRPDGLTATAYRDPLAAMSERTVKKVAKGIFPHNSPGRAQLKKLHVYADPEHPHVGQPPIPYELTQVAQWPLVAERL